jgi:putative ABC transport system permease protein
MFYTSYRGRKGALINWTHWFSATYVQLEKGCNPTILESKIQTLVEKHIGERSQNEFHLQALTKIYLNNINPPIGKSGDIRYIYLFSGIAFISILIACFNYMNLSTARSAHRFKEVGIRKIVGANRPHLIRQFLGESTLLAIISLIFSLFLVRLLLPAFGSLTDRELDFNLFYDSWMLFALICIIVLIGTISGSYPAIFLSSFSPLNTLKGGFKASPKKSSGVRNSLVIIQFVFSIGLIICTFTVHNQLSYIKNRDLGFRKDHIIIVPATGMNLERDYEPLKNELSQYSQISDVSVSNKLPSLITGGGGAKWEGKTDENIRFTRGFVDYNFLDLYGIELLEGRNFSKRITTDIEQAYILNQTAVKAIGWKSPIGKRFNQWGNEDGVVIGVMDDFHFLSLHRKIEPLVLSLIQNEWEEATYLSIKTSSKDIAGTLSFIEKKLNEFSPEYLFSYSFFDEQIDRMYRSEQKLGQSFIYFTLITVFVACLGLFGLTSFTAEQKTKEIGIRKVLGASVSGIVCLLSRELVKWVFIANLIAWPLAWLFSNRWLQNFAYRINVSIWTFILSATLALAIALITVSYQSIKAAMANPVDSLRYE